MSIHWCIRKAQEAQTRKADWNLLSGGELPAKVDCEHQTSDRADFGVHASDSTADERLLDCR
jgi:hypothetical protein